MAYETPAIPAVPAAGAASVRAVLGDRAEELAGGKPALSGASITAPARALNAWAGRLSRRGGSGVVCVIQLRQALNAHMPSQPTPRLVQRRGFVPLMDVHGMGRGYPHIEPYRNLHDKNRHTPIPLQVLERKALALVQESEDMASMAVECAMEAQRTEGGSGWGLGRGGCTAECAMEAQHNEGRLGLGGWIPTLLPFATAAAALSQHLSTAAALLVKRQEEQEWQARVDSVTAGDLPAYGEV